MNAHTHTHTHTLHPGALTKTIVATKERLEGDLPQGKQLPSHHPGISEAQRRKEREMVAKEVCVCGLGEQGRSMFSTYVHVGGHLTIYSSGDLLVIIQWHTHSSPWEWVVNNIFAKRKFSYVQ